MSLLIKKPLDYASAGVNIDTGQQFIEQIKPLAKRTHNSKVLGNLGNFSGFFSLPIQQYKEPILVANTDGVGTKLKLAIKNKQLDGLGIDLVAMCSNDLLTCGAQPLFFLDYYATGKLELTDSVTVMKSIVTGCQIAKLALLGGETAEMPSLYKPGDFDLAGFCVGVIEKESLITGSNITKDCKLIGIRSSGIHSNGFSLVNHIVNEQDNLSLKFIKQLLKPTRIYEPILRDLITKKLIKGASHITGGGLLENVGRILPENLQAIINTNSWPRPEIFTWLQDSGGITSQEMYKVFNMGIGFVLVVENTDLEFCLKFLASQGEDAFEIGYIDNSNETVNYNVLLN